MLILLSVKDSGVAVAEASRTKTPVIGIVDSDASFAQVS